MLSVTCNPLKETTSRICRHCARKRAGRGRGLCAMCHLDLSIRALYPLAQAPKTWTNPSGEPPLPHAPTDAMPGTEEKIQVLEQRVVARVALWHPADAT